MTWLWHALFDGTPLCSCERSRAFAEALLREHTETECCPFCRYFRPCRKGRRLMRAIDGRGWLPWG